MISDPDRQLSYQADNSITRVNGMMMVYLRARARERVVRLANIDCLEGFLYILLLVSFAYELAIALLRSTFVPIQMILRGVQ